MLLEKGMPHVTTRNYGSLYPWKSASHHFQSFCIKYREFQIVAY